MKTLKTKTFYNIDYIPNKLVYIYHISKTEIFFLGFYKEKNSPYNAVKISVNKKSSNDFKPNKIKFDEEKINKMINEILITN